MVQLLVIVLILVLVFGAIFYAVRVIPIDQPFKNIAYLVVLVLFIIVLLGAVGLLPGGSLIHLG
jgi:hypothetical protein